MLVVVGEGNCNLAMLGGYVEWAAFIEKTPSGAWEGNIAGKWGDKISCRTKRCELSHLLRFAAEMTVTFYDSASDRVRSTPTLLNTSLNVSSIKIQMSVGSCSMIRAFISARVQQCSTIGGSPTLRP